MTTVAEESFSNVRTVKAFSNEDEETEKFYKYSKQVFIQGRTKGIWQGFFSFFVSTSMYGAMIAIIFIASKLYEHDKITIGAITAFLFYLILLLFNFGMLAAVFGNLF